MEQDTREVSMQLFIITTYSTRRPANSSAPLPGALHMSPREFLKLTSHQVPAYSESFHQPGEAGIPNVGTPSFHNQQEGI